MQPADPAALSAALVHARAEGTPMSAISPVVTCSTLYEYQTPDGRIVPLIYTRLATPEEREAILRADRGGLSYDEWRAKCEREERT